MFQVLVTEPDHALFQKIRVYLPENSFQLWRADSLAESFPLLEAIRMDAVLISSAFPEGGARAMLQHLLTEAIDAPLVVWCHPGEEAAGRRLVLEGAADCLTLKPGTWELLEPVLRKAIAQRRWSSQLAASELKYRSLFHYSPHGLILLSADGVVLDANRAVEEILQIPRAELFGRRLAEHFPPTSEIRRFLETPFVLAPAGRQTVSVELGPAKRWLELCLHPMEPRIAPHYLLLVQEVTETRRAYAELADSEAHYRDIFENVGAMLVILDESLRVTEVNRWTEEWTGRTREELQGFDLAANLREQGRGEWLEQRLQELQTHRESHGRLEVRLFGREAVLECHVTAIFQEGQLVGYRLAFQDLTYQVKLERQRQELQLELLEKNRLAALGRLLQGIAHNLNNPITILQSTLDWIRSEGVEAVNLSEELEVMHDQVRRLREILTNIQEKGRREAFRRVERLNLNAVLETELKMLQANPFFKHEVKLETQFLPLPEIMGIYSDFSQTFSNLLNNALDAMYDRPVKLLKVSTACRPGEILIEIQDTGAGITAEVLPHIFEPFFSTKPHVSVDGRPAGTGLGLYACRMLLDPYGVKFEVDSQPGLGSHFRIRIPIQPSRTVRVLLVEHETTLRLGWQSGLRAFNLAVTAAESAEAALALGNGFDFYLVDAGLPGLNALDYLSRLRAQAPEAKILLLAGAESSYLIPRARALGVNLILPKPAGFREIAQAVALLDQSNSPLAAGGQAETFPPRA